MALSEYERRKLEEIERSLHRGDPALATILVSGVVRRHRRVVAAVVFAGGLGALVAGAGTAGSLPALVVAMSVGGSRRWWVAPGCSSRVRFLPGALRPPAAQVRVPVRLGAPEWRPGCAAASKAAANSRWPGRGGGPRAGPILRVVRFLMLKNDRDEGRLWELKITINRPRGPG